MMANIGEDDDDIPCLSEESIIALKEFIAEQTSKDTVLHNRNALNNTTFLSTSEIQENWQLSQFWYDEETAKVLSNEICRAAGENGKICLISCPTLYKPVKELCVANEVKLLEYDTRFSVYGSDYVFYDYKEPSNIPEELAHAYDVLVLDPPFLSEECLEKTASTAKLLLKDKVILCTGVVMEELAKKLLNVEICKFEPKHKNNLANEFRCYANYNLDDFISRTNKS